MNVRQHSTASTAAIPLAKPRLSITVYKDDEASCMHIAVSTNRLKPAPFPIEIPITHSAVHQELDSRPQKVDWFSAVEHYQYTRISYTVGLTPLI